MFIDRIFVSTRMSSLVFPRLSKERRRRADAEQEAEKWRQRAEQLQVQDEARARSVLDDARVDFGRAEDERKAAEDERKAAAADRAAAGATLKKAEELMARARRAGQWAAERASKVIIAEEALAAREQAVRDEEESHELKRLGIYPTTTITDSDLQSARYELGLVPNAINVCVTGAPRSGKSSLINALRGVDATDAYAAPVLGFRPPESGRPAVYYDAKTPGLVYHEVPEGRTAADLSGWDYYLSRRLYAFDVLVLVHSDSPDELETRIAQIAHRRGQPCLHIRTKADEHIRNTRRISKYVAVGDARGAYLSRVHDEANQRCEAASTLEALRPPRDCEFVVSEMGLYRLVTGGEKDPDEVYGTGEEDEARLLAVFGGLVKPRVEAAEEQAEDTVKTETADASTGDNEEMSKEEQDEVFQSSQQPTVEEVIAQVEAALQIGESGGEPSGQYEEYEDEHQDELEPEPTPATEAPFETSLESAPQSEAPVANGHAAGEANGVAKHQATVEDTIDEETTQVVAIRLEPAKEVIEIKDEEPIGSCGERV